MSAAVSGTRCTALALRMRGEPASRWPDRLLMLGDQVYVDEGSPDARARIQATRDTSVPPGPGVRDFEEYTWVYQESWSDPVIRLGEWSAEDPREANPGACSNAR
jgi:hypothetical protein